MKDLVQLKQAALDASEGLASLSLRNTYGKTAEELVELDLAYARAQARFSAAESEYRKALAQTVNTNG